MRVVGKRPPTKTEDIAQDRIFVVVNFETTR